MTRWLLPEAPRARRRRVAPAVRARRAAVAPAPAVAGRVLPEQIPLPFLAHASPVGAPPRVHVMPVAPAVALRKERSGLRRLFRRAEGPPFLAEGTPERRLLEWLAAPTMAEARRAGIALAAAPLNAAQRALADHVRDVGLGLATTGAAWGADPAEDALRVRLLRATRRAEVFEVLPWTRVLQWAGERLPPEALPELPPAAVPAALAALAATRGYPAALAAARALRPPREAVVAEALAAVALRVVLRGRFEPEVAAALAPMPARRRTREGQAERWLPLLCAWHAVHEQDDAVARVTLTAVIAATELRQRWLAVVPPVLAPAVRRAWGAPADEDALAFAVTHGRGLPDVWRIGRPAWPGEWGGPDVRALGEALAALLAPHEAFAREVFLDDTLAVAAVFGVLGYGPSGLAQLASARVPRPLEAARAALQHALARPRPAAPLAVLPAGSDIGRIRARLAETEDPSVLLATPLGLLGAPGAFLSMLMREGKPQLAKDVRLLAREDVLRDLRPLWILRGGAAEAASVHALARWIAAREVPTAGEPAWLRFLEARIRAREEEDADGR
jgi:hypothetical protein